jgi:plasmid stabilization system protein ParE
MFRTWAIFYRVLPSHIDVMRIVHGGMRMETLFRR